MTNREKYAKSTLDEVFDAYNRVPTHHPFSSWLDMSAEDEPRADKPEEPKPDNPFAATAGRLLKMLAGPQGELPTVNVWVMVNGRTA